MLPIIIQQPSTNTWIDLMTAIIPAVVTIIGFIINYFALNKTIKDQISKKKTDISLEYLSDVPLLSLKIFDLIRDQKYDEMFKVFNELANKIFSYGSNDAIKVLAELQQLNYKIGNKLELNNPYEIIPYYTLLTCQVKFDLTGIKVNPEYWYKLRLKDYETNLIVKKQLINATNKVVKNLKLRKYLKIK